MLEHTAERTLPQHDAQTREDLLVYLKQVALYNFAQTLSAGKAVLDLGCGEGYGSARLAASARLVIGVDNSFETVVHAAQKYSRPNTAFVLCDAQQLPFRDGAFETVVSFEVIEHVVDVRGYVQEVRRVCGKTALFSTPNRLLRLLPFQKPWNTFHLREYDDREFRRALDPVFKAVNLLGLTARPDLLEIEKRRVRQNPLVAYPRMLARMVLPASLYQRAKRIKPLSASDLADDVIQKVSPADYMLSPTALKSGITLVAICE
jgi:ubiquinone/menaquinone biosynthesis C-methylase UbiE